MKRCCITGHTKGLGLSLYNQFIEAGWQVEGFSRGNNYDLTTNFDLIIEKISGCDLFINNTYANGVQIPLLLNLYTRVNNIVSCGSVSSDFNNEPEYLDYAKTKRLLEYHVSDLSHIKRPNTANLLLLKLTSSSYKNPTSLFKIINCWLENPDMTIVTFNITDDGPYRPQYVSK